VEALRRKKSKSSVWEYKCKDCTLQTASWVLGGYLHALCFVWWTCCLVPPWGQRQRDVSPLGLLSRSSSPFSSQKLDKEKKESIYRLVFWNSYP